LGVGPELHHRVGILSAIALSVLLRFWSTVEEGSRSVRWASTRQLDALPNETIERPAEVPNAPA